MYPWGYQPSDKVQLSAFFYETVLFYVTVVLAKWPVQQANEYKNKYINLADNGPWFQALTKKKKIGYEPPGFASWTLFW